MRICPACAYFRGGFARRLGLTARHLWTIRGKGMPTLPSRRSLKVSERQRRTRGRKPKVPSMEDAGIGGLLDGIECAPWGKAYRSRMGHRKYLSRPRGPGSRRGATSTARFCSSTKSAPGSSIVTRRTSLSAPSPHATRRASSSSPTRSTLPTGPRSSPKARSSSPRSSIACFTTSTSYRSMAGAAVCSSSASCFRPGPPSPPHPMAGKERNNPHDSPGARKTGSPQTA